MYNYFVFTYLTAFPFVNYIIIISYFEGKKGPGVPLVRRVVVVPEVVGEEVDGEEVVEGEEEVAVVRPVVVVAPTELVVEEEEEVGGRVGKLAETKKKKIDISTNNNCIKNKIRTASGVGANVARDTIATNVSTFVPATFISFTSAF